MRPSTCLQHLLNVFLPALVLTASHAIAVQLLAAILLFFGVFSLVHDAMHGALRLPREWNELLLGLSAAAIGVSGHAARWFHLRHHADPLGPADVEAPPLERSWARVLLGSPMQYLALPVLGWRRAPRHTRRLQLLEWLAVVSVAAVLACSPAGRVYLAIVALAQLTIPIWGGRLPHQPNARLFALLRPLVWTRSPLVLGYVFHLPHHERPRLSLYEWPATRAGQFPVDETLRGIEKCEARSRGRRGCRSLAWLPSCSLP